MTEQTATPPLAAATYIMLDGPKPRLEFLKCEACGAMYLEPDRVACSKCGGRNSFVRHEPGYEGVLHTSTIVHRGFPGVAVPFISAIVDLDDGPTLKGNLRGVGFTPEDTPSGMRVKVVFDDALGRKDTAGNAYISHFFEPADAA